MPQLTVDGRLVEFQAGEKVIEVAKRAGVFIPYFCYHPGLSVVAQCRMCAVEIEKMPKLQTACSTIAAEGMVVKTRSEKTLQNQKSVMEFLLINHPLDCPICDKSGECDLQDFSYDYGDPYSRYTEERRAYIDVDMGPVIQKNMNRCIHCTRCIRFGEEIAGIREMVALQRGNRTEITTIEEKPLETEYAGNYADICPTGSLGLKDFRFTKRVWMLKKTATICEGCSRGCNMEIHQDANVIYRCVPRENLEVNRYWLCDEGRFHFRSYQKNRVLMPQGKGSPMEWSLALEACRAILRGKKLLVLVGSDMTQEEITLVREVLSLDYPGSALFHFGTLGVKSVAEDADADGILKRKSKTSNLHGLEHLGVEAWDGRSTDAEALLVIRGGRAELGELPAISTVGIGVFQESEVKQWDVVLPGLSFAEKDGSVMNFQGKLQFFRRAIAPQGQSKGLAELFMMLRSDKSSQVGVAS
jgi:NADH-quinone oxidoreductase subunit G